MRIGMSEILVILLAALILFGPNRLPEMGKALGKAIREFRNATSDLSRELEEVREEVTRAAAPAAEPPAEAATDRTSPEADVSETMQEEGDGQPKPQPPGDEAPHGYHSS